MRTSTLRSHGRRSRRSIRSATTVASAVAALVTSAALLTGCVIGDVDRNGGADAASDPSDASGSGTGAPQPTAPAGAQATQNPDTGTSGDLELPAELGEFSVALLDDGTLHTGGTLGDGGDLTDAAWSTSKVPLAIAALRQAEADGDPAALEQVTASIRQAIGVSDNGAADALWASLGEPATAAQKVEAVLADAGVSTDVPAERPRGEFSAYGQTRWSVSDQARFAGQLGCLSSAGPVVEAMGQVDPGQSYGIGRVDGAWFKGGWGPGADGRYLVRQFGLVPGDDGTSVPVAVAVIAPDGSYESAQGALDDVVEALRDRIDAATGVTSPGEQADC